MTSGAPFQRTSDAEKKPVPFTVRVKPTPPAAVELGTRPVMEEVGGKTVNVTGAESTSDGVLTVTEAVPGVAMLAAGTVAVS